MDGFLFETRSSLYDFVLLGSIRESLKEEGRLSLRYPCINVRTLSLYVSSLRTFSLENNGFECALKVLLLIALIAFFAKISFFSV